MDRSHLHREYLTAKTAHGSVRRAYWVSSESPNFDAGTLRVASGQKQAARRDAVISPKQTSKISYGILFSKEANKGVDHALDAINKVHGVPANINGCKINVTAIGGGINGLYTLDKSNKIYVNKWSFGSASTLAHEYGHYLDHNLFGNGEYGMRGLGTIQRNKELSGTMNAIYRSEAVKNLVKKAEEADHANDWHGKRVTGYLLMRPELFARAYAQWIGLRGSKQIHEETAAYGRAWKSHGYDAQWSDKDFEPIAREFDKLFAGRRLLRGRAK